MPAVRCVRCDGGDSSGSGSAPSLGAGAALAGSQHQSSEQEPEAEGSPGAQGGAGVQAGGEGSLRAPGGGAVPPVVFATWVSGWVMQPAAALLSRAVVHCGGEPQCLRFRNQSVQSYHRNVGAPDARGCPPQPGKGRWTGQRSGGLPAHAAAPAPAWGSGDRQLGFRTAARSGAVWAARPHSKGPRSPQPAAASTAWRCGLALRPGEQAGRNAAAGWACLGGAEEGGGALGLVVPVSPPHQRQLRH